jgi:hypothetical protein
MLVVILPRRVVVAGGMCKRASLPYRRSQCPYHHLHALLPSCVHASQRHARVARPPARRHRRRHRPPAPRRLDLPPRRRPRTLGKPARAGRAARRPAAAGAADAPRRALPPGAGLGPRRGAGRRGAGRLAGQCGHRHAGEVPRGCPRGRTRRRPPRASVSGGGDGGEPRHCRQTPLRNVDTPSARRGIEPRAPDRATHQPERAKQVGRRGAVSRGNNRRAGACARGAAPGGAHTQGRERVHEWVADVAVVAGPGPPAGTLGPRRRHVSLAAAAADAVPARAFRVARGRWRRARSPQPLPLSGRRRGHGRGRRQHRRRRHPHRRPRGPRHRALPRL